MFVENLYSSVFVLSADAKLNIKSVADLKAYVEGGNEISVAVNGAMGSEAAGNDILILVDDVLHVLDVGLHVGLAHGVHFQQHGVLEPLGHFLVGQDLWPSTGPWAPRRSWPPPCSAPWARATS